LLTVTGAFGNPPRQHLHLVLAALFGRLGFLQPLVLARAESDEESQAEVE
jgi:hypothetical protein